MITTEYYLLLSAALFVIGAFGVLTRRNLIMILLSIEIMLNAVNLSFVASAHALGDVGGQVATLFVIAIAAAEVAIGLSIAVALFRSRDTLDPQTLTLMKD